jgi:hypothetical protein
MEEIGSGLVGKVYKANRKQNGECLVLKSFSSNNNDIVREIVNEVKRQMKVFNKNLSY